MSTYGVVYFHLGTACRVRLLVSLYSLRKVYAGPVAILQCGDADAWFRAEAQRLGATFVDFPRPDGDRALLIKAASWRHSPFDRSLFIDADTIVCRDPSPLFAFADAPGYAVTQFCDWRSDSKRIARRINAWRPVVGRRTLRRAVAHGPAVNTGVFVYRKDHPILPAIEDLSRSGQAAKCCPIMLDELAAQILLPQFPTAIIPSEWNTSGKFGKVEGAGIVHFHGDKHVSDRAQCELWKRTYWEYRNTSPAYAELGDAAGDKRLRRYLASVQRADMTVVTAVNGAYMDKLRRNWPAWMATPGIREQRFVVFWHGERPSFLEVYQNVDLLEWNFAPAGSNMRELMLSAFVFGVAKAITTPWWMKLDCDAKPTGKAWEWPKAGDWALTGHRCGYTKRKGAPGLTRHFLNVLDDWWHDMCPQVEFERFPIIEGTRHRHSRVATYCAVEATAHTREVAELCGRRLPVPSQDTVSWYVAWRRGRGIVRENMHRWFLP